MDPSKFEITPGEILEGNLRNGENYKGNPQYYLKRFFTRFEVFDGNKSHKVIGENGDRPALKFKTANSGLHILIYQSTFDSLIFKEWEKFIAYAQNQSLDGAVQRHLERGLPQTGFRENYARTVKSLVRVGEGKGEDRLTGMPFEFVAQENPYTLTDKADFLNVRLYLDNNPAPHKQVLIFQNNGRISHTKTRTDEEGYVKIPLAGGGKFMLSSVHLFEGDDDPDTKTPEWLSYWANLTFARPGADELLDKSPNN